MTLRWSLVVALTGFAGLAMAQPEDVPAPEVTEPNSNAADDVDVAADGDGEAELADTANPTESAEEPVVDAGATVQRTTDSRVIDTRQEDLDREQREAERAEGGRPAVSVLEQVDPEHGESERPIDNRRHAGTVGLRVGMGFHYDFQIKYVSGPRCDSTDPMVEVEEFCNRLGEPYLDLELSYSVNDKLEIGLFTMLAFGDDPIARNPTRIFGLGVRGYTSEAAVAKGFFGVRVVIDHTQGNVENWSNVDVGLRGEFGLHVDIIRWLGVFVGGEVMVRFLRGFALQPGLHAGLMTRFP